ncbi:Rho-binding antiterminator [Balneatrix alpica]|uniref:Rho-binding antiterminator n=1 Tax=Balneatrix alpica TaxID=75684 RepID=A0ABV5ZAL2_9GAMM|nr:Rho-binding antiterminator [Balneatrix alpica]
MSTYQPLDCDLHDYLEIACLFHYQLLIELTDGSRLQALPLTTRTASDQCEYLEVETAQGRQSLRLDQLLAITPVAEQARFGRILLQP